MEVDWAWASERRAGASGSSGDDDDDVRSFFGSTVRIENNWRAEAVSFFWNLSAAHTPQKNSGKREKTTLLPLLLLSVSLVADLGGNQITIKTIHFFCASIPFMQSTSKTGNEDRSELGAELKLV